MYLFVFVFLVLSVMGLYTELLVVRIARSAANQTIAAETMQLWHTAQYEYMKATDAFTSFSTGCSLTYMYGTNCFKTPCTYYLPAYTSSPTTCNASRNYLPQGYLFVNAALRFNTIYYRSTSPISHYIITFVQPTEVRLGFRADQIYKQLKNSGIPKISYGVVDTTACMGGTTGRWLVTQEYIGGNQVCYPVPSIVPDGSVAIVTNLGS